jgi:hypothetical protein
MTGYSSTPLAKKLGFKPGCEVLLVDAPAEYSSWLAPLPPNVRFTARLAKTTELIHVFTTSKKHLKKTLEAYRTKIQPDAAIWVSWPKKASKVETDITEDVIREIALPLDYVDIKVCAVSEVWSGLKLVIRKELR